MASTTSEKLNYLKELEKYKIVQVVTPAPKMKTFTPKPDPIILKLHPDPHPLSIEQQALFLKITEGAFGYNEHIRNESLNILSKDYHITYLAAYLCEFIREAVFVNIAFPDLSLLIYAIRMAKSLVGNGHVDLKQHLHVLLPAILSCVLSKKISKYQYDNHWTLRDFSAQLVASICTTHSNRTNQIKTRVIKMYLKAIQDPRKPFTTLYGGIKGLGCLGDDTIKACILPMLPFISRRIYTYVNMGEAHNEHRNIKEVIELVVNVSGPLLLQYNNTSDGGVAYVREFGYLGYSLYTHVKNLEKIQANKRGQINVCLVCK